MCRRPTLSPPRRCACPGCRCLAHGAAVRGLGTSRARARALTSARIPALPRLVAAASLPSRRGLATTRACTSSRTHHLATALLAVRTAQAHVAVGYRPCLLSPRAYLAAQSRRGRALRDPALTSPPSPCPALAPDRVKLFGHRPAPPDRTLASPSPPEDPAAVAAWRTRHHRTKPTEGGAAADPRACAVSKGRREERRRRKRERKRRRRRAAILYQPSKPSRAPEPACEPLP